MLKPADRFWRNLTRGVRVKSAKDSADALAVDTILPWLAHDGMIHLTAPHGLEQYTGGAWGTRDVCQGSIELLLTLEHDQPVKEILRILFAQQYEESGDWPQWFMLEPYSVVQDKESHGDIIVWPLKALCDYIEATGDFAFLDEAIAWRRADNFDKTAHADPVTAHIDKLIETVRARFIPGTNLVRYGHGDWNDFAAAGRSDDERLDDERLDGGSPLRAASPLRRNPSPGEARAKPGEGARRARGRGAQGLQHASHSRRRGRRLWRVPPEGGEPELLLHPSDKKTGLAYSLLPMTQSMIGGMFTQAQARKHLSLIRKHLLFSDGARLMDKPIAYHGGPETFFQRAELAAFFGREIGLMYTHSHLRYGEAMSDIGEFEALWEALLVANPIAVTDELPTRVAEAAERLFQLERRGVPGSVSGERRMGARQSERDRRRWRLAHLFERPRPLRQYADPPCLRAAAPVREANCDAGLEKVAQGPQPRMAWAAWRRLAAAVMKAA